MRYPDEPHEIVRGVAIHVGAIDMLVNLRASGHNVYLDELGELTVDQRDELHEDIQYLLDELQEDLAILLHIGGATIH